MFSGERYFPIYTQNGHCSDSLNSLLPIRAARFVALHPTDGFSPQFPFWPHRYPNTFAILPSARSYRPRTRQSYVGEKGNLSIVTKSGSMLNGDQYQFTCISFFHPKFLLSVCAGQRIDRSSIELRDPLLQHRPS